jgi:hypothetical protein
MTTKNVSAAAKELKALNKRARELMRVIKSGKASDAQIKEFSAMPRDVGPARGKIIPAMIALRKDKAPA